MVDMIFLHIRLESSKVIHPTIHYKLSQTIMSHPQLQYSLFQQNPKNTTEKKTGLNCKIPKYLYALITAFKPQL